jgi:hypothetical protein
MIFMFLLLINTDRQGIRDWYDYLVSDYFSYFCCKQTYKILGHIV